MDNDLISRQAAIEIVERYDKSHMALKQRPMLGAAPIVMELEELPSAQPEKHTEEHTETHACDYQRTETHDLVSRRAALEAMDTWDKFGCDPDGKLVRYDDDKHYVPYVHYEDMVHAVKNLPSAQPRWIPCEERLPEEQDEYLVTWVTKRYSGKRLVGIGIFEYDLSEDNWLFDDYMNAYVDATVTAWMPLPEPYKEGQDET